MPTQYTDIFVRDSFADDGTIPSTGNPTASPDIIPLQGGSLGFPKAATTYPLPPGPDLGLPVAPGHVNNIYVRAKNNGTAPSSGTVNLFYSASNLMLAPPWNPISTPAGSAVATMLDVAQSSTIAGGAICLSNPAFLLTNVPALPPNAHYCLVAVINTPLHPITIPASFATNADFALWVQQNPAVGWRNIALVPGGNAQLVATYGFSNLTASQWVILCTATGFPTGAPVSVQSTDARVPFQQNGVLPAPDPNHNNQQIVSFAQFMPAIDPAVLGSIVATVTAPTGTLPTDGTFSTKAYQVPDAARALDLAVARVVHVGRDSRQATSGDGQAGLIKLGEFTTIIGAG